MLNKPHYKRHADDEWFDEVRIRIVPRFKTSGLSGDEWRVSALVQMLRKGQVLKEKSFGDLRTAMTFLPTMRFYGAPADNDEERQFQGEDTYCFQPGCGQKAIAEYRLKKEYCNEGHPHDPVFETRRNFCQRHLRRGDGGLEDADENYEVLSGPGPSEARGWEDDESPSVFGGVIDLRESGEGNGD